MNNSICLPLPEFAAEATELTRCFVVWRTGEIREVASYPFEPYIIEQLLTARDWAKKLNMDAEFTTTLFFPESWPPQLIKDFLEAPRPSIDSGIHLPIAENVELVDVPVECFSPFQDTYRKIEWRPLRQWTISFFYQDSADWELIAGRSTGWCSKLFFPKKWPPEAIYDWLNAESVQGDFFPF